MANLIHAIYQRVIARRRKAISFIILISFLLAFVVARLMVYLIDINALPDFYVAAGQTHVHHLNFGIFLLSISGYLSLIFNNRKMTEKLAIMYGVGLGLTFDEFSLWLHLQNNYYARVSYEAIIVIVALLINIIYFGDIWKKLFLFTFFRKQTFRERIVKWTK